MEPENVLEITRTHVLVAGRSFPLEDVTDPRMTVTHRPRCGRSCLGCLGGIVVLWGVTCLVAILDALTWSTGVPVLAILILGALQLSIAPGWLQGTESEYHLTVSCAHGECIVLTSKDPERVRRNVATLREALAARRTAS